MKVRNHVICVIICSRCWHIQWYQTQQILIKISLNILFDFQILLILCVCPLLWQEIHHFKSIFIGSLKLKVLVVNRWSWSIFLKFEGFSNRSSFFEWRNVRIIWLNRHLMLVINSFFMHNVIILVLIKCGITQFKTFGSRISRKL